MLRILADENLPGDVVDALRQAGHDVAWIRTDHPGVDDRTVLAFAHAQNRLLVTMDKDFGTLVFKDRRQAPHGIILLRLDMPNPRNAGTRVVEIFESRQDWPEHFSVIDDIGIRMIRLPL